MASSAHLDPERPREEGRCQSRVKYMYNIYIFIAHALTKGSITCLSAYLTYPTFLPGMRWISNREPKRLETRGERKGYTPAHRMPSDLTALIH